MNDAAPEFNFEHDLPAGVESFSVHWLSARWLCSIRHVVKLIEAGEFGRDACVDLRGANSSKSMYRLRRAAVVAFLNKRKDLVAVSESNPQPKARALK